MDMMPFIEVFPTQGEQETRCITLTRKHRGLSPDRFSFIEMFCTDPDCDCRRAMIQVFDSKGQFRACLSYGWEDLKFYAEWMGDDEFIDQIPGVNLYQMTAQGANCQELLELFRECLETDPSYRERIQRHYYQMKERCKGGLVH